METFCPDGTIHLVCRGLPTSKNLFFYSPSADGLATYLFYAAPSVTLYLFNYSYGIPLWIQAEQLLEHPLLLAPFTLQTFASLTVSSPRDKLRKSL